MRPQGDLVVSSDREFLETRVRVPETGAGGLDVTVRCAGVFRHVHKKQKTVSVSVEVTVENRSESVTAGFDPSGATLTDGSGRHLSPVAPVVSGAVSSDTTTVALEPGARRTFNLDFRSEGTGDPRSVVPFSLRLPFDYGKSEVPVVVRFVRDEYPYGYGYPGYYEYGAYPYGPGWGPGFGYYGPGWYGW